jgi:hypothetical protein
MRMDGAIDLFPTTTVNGRSLPVSAEAQGDCFECSRTSRQTSNLCIAPKSYGFADQ